MGEMTQGSELRGVEFNFRLDGEQTVTLLAAIDVLEDVSDRQDFAEIRAILYEQFEMQK